MEKVVCGVTPDVVLDSVIVKLPVAPLGPPGTSMSALVAAPNWSLSTLTVRRAATVTCRRPGSASTVDIETLEAVVQSRSDQVRYCWPNPDAANELGSSSPMPTGAVVQDSMVGAMLYRNQRSMRKLGPFLVSHSN